MMTVLVLDTLKFSQKLREAGFEEKQANVVAQAIAEVIESELATSKHLKDLELNLKPDLREMELVQQKNLAETKAELIRWVVGMAFVQISLISALLLKQMA